MAGVRPNRAESESILRNSLWVSGRVSLLTESCDILVLDKLCIRAATPLLIAVRQA